MSKPKEVKPGGPPPSNNEKPGELKGLYPAAIQFALRRPDGHYTILESIAGEVRALEILKEGGSVTLLSEHCFYREGITDGRIQLSLDAMRFGPRSRTREWET